MNENIDLTKILKDCPVGWHFWSSVYGEVDFIEIYSKPVLCNPRPRDGEWLGQDIHDYEHPILFDSDGFDHRVSSRGEMIKGRGECTFFPSRDQRDWSKFTAPWYKKEKFDPKTLKQFDRVLARIDGGDVYCWFADFVSTPTIEKYDILPCIMSNKGVKMIIPYNDDTRHLVGTTDEAPEYYRYWKN